MPDHTGAGEAAATDPENAVHWPTLRSKLWPITVIRLPGGWCWWPCVEFRNWYHGPYWQVEYGWWLVLGGACEIKDAPAISGGGDAG